MLCYLQSGPLSGSALNKGLQLGKIGVLLSDRAQRRASDHQEHPLIDLNYLWQGHVALSQSENLRPLRDPTLPKTLLLFYIFPQPSLQRDVLGSFILTKTSFLPMKQSGSVVKPRPSLCPTQGVCRKFQR